MDSTTVINDGITTAGHSHEEDDGSAILVARVVTMCALGLVSIIMGLVPLQLARWFGWSSNDMTPRSARVIELLLGIGGGVLLSTTFLHILPEVRVAVGELLEDEAIPSISVSWAELLMCAGFFLMYLAEEIVHVYIRKYDRERNEAAEVSGSTKDVNQSTNDLVESGQNKQPQINHLHGYGHGHSHMPLPADHDNSFVSSLRGLLIVLGLSIHELFEGLAVGFSTTARDVWYLFGAVAAHKFVIAFCIGIELIASKTRFYLIVIYIFTYSMVSPLGIGIAMMLMGGGLNTAATTVNVVLQGLATGTLLYVVFFEILRKQRHGLLQYLAVMCGFLIMFTIQMTTGHEHTHSHSHSH